MQRCLTEASLRVAQLYLPGLAHNVAHDARKEGRRSYSLTLLRISVHTCVHTCVRAAYTVLAVRSTVMLPRVPASSTALVRANSAPLMRVLLRGTPG